MSYLKTNEIRYRVFMLLALAVIMLVTANSPAYAADVESEYVNIDSKNTVVITNEEEVLAAGNTDVELLSSNWIWDQSYTNKLNVEKTLLISWRTTDGPPNGCTITIKNTGTVTFRAHILTDGPYGGTTTINSSQIEPDVTRAFFIDSSYFVINEEDLLGTTEAQLVVYCADADNGERISLHGTARY